VTSVFKNRKNSRILRKF